MIETSVYVSFGLMIAFGLIFPVAVAIWWIKTRKEKITTVLLGAATWFVFAVILEQIPKVILFHPALSIGKTIMGNAVLFTITGALLAGVFEETGRYVVFKTLLRKRTNRETAISHGIGHGGFEAFFLLAFSGVQYLVYAVMIQSGSFQDIIDQAAATGVDTSSLQALPEQIMAMTLTSSCMAIEERIACMFLHVGLSILVFYAVKKSNPWLYILAIILHTLFDVPAALFQFGVIQNIYLIELLIAIYSIGFFLFVYRLLYKKDKAQQAA